MKFLFELESKKVVEGVLIPQRNRLTACISSQAGCSLACTFCATGQIKFSSSLRMNPKDLDLSLSSDIFTISKKVGDRVGFTVLNAIYPIMVTGVSNKINLDLNTGGDVVSVGQVFDLMQLGEKVKDAYTKESLGKSETKIGTVEITQVSPKQSRGKATLTDTNSDLSMNFKPKMYILRLNNSNKKKGLQKLHKKVGLELEINIGLHH